MLIICKRASESAMRPKYHQINRFPMWVVFNTETRVTVHGPTSRCVCQRFIDKRSETNGKRSKINEESEC
jgi:hypothetical protein